jgi:hypothetical protein
MRLIALEIPDDPSALPGWLERQMTGLDLGALVAELEAVHGPRPAEPGALDRVLGDRRSEVLERGLSALPPDRLGRLLRRPRLLLDLQALVLVEGGSHWRNLGPAEAGHREAVERGRARLARFLAGEAEGEGGRPRPETRAPARPGLWPRSRWFVSLSTAAAVLAALAVFDRTRPPVAVVTAPEGWGWARPGALPGDLPRIAYFERLVDAATEWYRARPDDPLALARRINEFRQGCSVLILSEHRPLSADDRQWLVEKCRAWAARLDAHLAAVETGDDPIKVRAEVDETVRKLIEAVRERIKAA